MGSIASAAQGVRFAQALLGTVNDLRDDLQACFDLHEVGPASSPMFQEGSPTRERVGDSGTAQERVLSFSARQQKPILFVGRDDAMLLVRQGANAQFIWEESEPLASEYQVLWLAPQTRAIRLPYAMDQQRTVEREYKVPTELDSRPATHRCSTPIIQPHANGESFSGNAHSVRAAWDKNTEVQQLSFRYFDGAVWQREWNSHLQNNRLPLAVEVQLTLTCSPRQPMRLVISSSRPSEK